MSDGEIFDEMWGRDATLRLTARAARLDQEAGPEVLLAHSGHGSTDPSMVIEALDYGAGGVMTLPFHADEAMARLTLLADRRRSMLRTRDQLRHGLQSALTDPLTGLYNRRYALPHLSRVTEEAQASGARFAVMLADIDHFKQVNDRFGHPVGDAVLVETALRLQSLLRPSDMLARVGGEEFLVVLAHTSPASAALLAERLRREINGRPYRLAGLQRDLPVSISVGLVLGPSGGGGLVATDMSAEDLITRADRALYRAKAGGRNKVSTFPEAA